MANCQVSICTAICNTTYLLPTQIQQRQSVHTSKKHPARQKHRAPPINLRKRREHHGRDAEPDAEDRQPQVVHDMADPPGLGQHGLRRAVAARRGGAHDCARACEDGQEGLARGRPEERGRVGREVRGWRGGGGGLGAGEGRRWEGGFEGEVAVFDGGIGVCEGRWGRRGWLRELLCRVSVSRGAIFEVVWIARQRRTAGVCLPHGQTSRLAHPGLELDIFLSVYIICEEDADRNIINLAHIAPCSAMFAVPIGKGAGVADVFFRHRPSPRDTSGNWLCRLHGERRIRHDDTLAGPSRATLF